MKAYFSLVLPLILLKYPSNFYCFILENTKDNKERRLK